MKTNNQKIIEKLDEANLEIEQILQDLKDKMAELTQESIDQIEDVMQELLQGLKQ
tara:strand:+ start:458 stop:622 length:165 start_codon:yes stop_codon:yes gene_type:complete